MEKMIKMQKARKEEKPVAMLIKGGMLFKDGKTTEEKKVGLPSSFFDNISYFCSSFRRKTWGCLSKR